MSTMEIHQIQLLICLTLSSAGGFFVDTDQPITFQYPDRSFGYQVVQMDEMVIVSAPTHQDIANKTGELYRCDPRTIVCQPITIKAPSQEVNTSLGLTLAAQQNPSQILACGPTVQRTCGNNVYVNGRCYRLDNRLQIQEELPSSLPECSVTSLDIVFLIDGSGSISTGDFILMLKFVSKVIESFSESDTLFALMQYSSRFETHFDFKRFSAVRDPDTLTRGITQQRGVTRTATAIQKVLRELFITERGNRVGSQKVLIVITDGEKYGDDLDYNDPINEAEQQGVRRFVIGVGNAFTTPKALEELNTIASSPPEDHVLTANDFSVLNKFQKQLQEKIFSIEGTQVQTGSNIQLEMSQDGLSAILTPDEVILGAVGAYGWSGGASVFRKGKKDSVWINATQDQTDMKDSYLGYALQKVTPDLIAIGAPRYQHTGIIIIYKRKKDTSSWNLKATARGDKIGSYFGSALGVVPLTSDQSRVLLLVGAPTYYSPEAPGGRVYLCPIHTSKMESSSRSTYLSCSDTLHGDTTQYLGQFGSAISLLPDLTGDNLPDLAIGAPGEDNNQGALYIFPGKKGGFRTSYIQRIAGSQVSSGLKLFGRSVSGNLDMTKDGLPDLTIGSEGRVLIFRSRPVLGISVSMTFEPSEILLASYECPDHKKGEAATRISVCVTSSLRSSTARGAVSAQLKYTLLLDAGRSQTRAVFDGSGRSVEKTLQLRQGPVCEMHSIRLPECVEDSLSPLRVAMNLSVSGESVLSEDSRTNHSEQVSFQKNCGSDGVCQDDLRITASFRDLTQLVIGVSLEVNVTVSVQNHGEDSYNTLTLISHPTGLSYRKVSLIQSNRRFMTISCSAQESQRQVNCGINNPLLRPNATAIFVVTFHVSTMADLGDTLTLPANVTSENGGSSTDFMRSTARIKVLYGVYVTVRSLDESTKYTNFSSESDKSSTRSVQHVYRVINLGQRPLPLSVVFLVPVRLKEIHVWEGTNITSSQSEFTNSSTVCTNTGETSPTEDFKEHLKTHQLLDCTVSTCVRFECNVSSLDIQNSIQFTITGQVTKDWAMQTEQKKVFLQSMAEIRYDSERYRHILEQSQPFLQAQTQTVLEVFEQYNYLPVIIGSSVGGLVLLALSTAGLYKLGFFKRQYKQMMEGTEAEAGDATESADAAQSNGGH
ncbi:integrin alpha-M-like [Rhinophrynus dorsalis]